MKSTIRASAARGAAVAIATGTAAVIPSVAVESASAVRGPVVERPCFIVQPRWNTAPDGPAPTCPTPIWQLATDDHS